MKKSKTAFLTTIFPASKEYLNDFFNSLLKQTDQDFDLIVVNDGIKNFKALKNKYSSLNIIEIISNNSPVENRIIGLKYIKDQEYEILIFGDSDDFFEKNRIQLSKQKLKKYDVVVNDLIPFYKNEKGVNIFNKLIDNKLNFKNHILTSNIFGLSNTAINVSILKNTLFNINNKIIAFDWIFFTQLIVVFSKKACFFNSTHTYYRQYELNTVGINKTINKKSLDKIIEIKIQHFEELKRYCNSNKYLDYSTIFEKELLKINELKQYLSILKNKKEYISIINANIDIVFKGWWSQAISLKKYKKIQKNENRD